VTKANRPIAVTDSGKYLKGGIVLANAKKPNRKEYLKSRMMNSQKVAID
jgi:preprotein translocase subunit Sss1